MSWEDTARKQLNESSLVSEDYLSTRSALFTAYATVALTLMVPSFSGDVRSLAMTSLISAGVCLAMVLFWTLTLRHLESPDMLPAAVVLNLIPSAVACIFLNDYMSIEGLVFLSGGFTCLAITSSDLAKRKKASEKGFTDIDFLNGEFVKSNDYVKPDAVSEVLLPFLFASVVSVFGIASEALVKYGTGSVGKGLRLFIASLALMALSFVVSKIRGKDLYFSSKNMCDPTRLPTVSFPALRSFLLRRVRFILSFILIAGGCLLSDFINAEFDLGFPYIKNILALLLVFAFAFIRGRHSHHKVQFTLELGIIYAFCTTHCTTIGDTLLFALVGTFMDTLINGFLYTHNRRLIMSRRNKHIEGMPLELMSVSIVFMIFEVLLAYWIV